MKILATSLLCLSSLYAFSASARPIFPDTQPAVECPAKQEAGTACVVLAVGEEVTVGPNLILTYNGMIDDSRCPIDVLCAKAGNATGSFTIHTHNHTQSQEFSLFLDPSSNLEHIWTDDTTGNTFALVDASARLLKPRAGTVLHDLARVIVDFNAKQK